MPTIHEMVPENLAKAPAPLAASLEIRAGHIDPALYYSWSTDEFEMAVRQSLVASGLLVDNSHSGSVVVDLVQVDAPQSGKSITTGVHSIWSLEDSTNGSSLFRVPVSTRSSSKEFSAENYTLTAGTAIRENISTAISRLVSLGDQRTVPVVSVTSHVSDKSDHSEVDDRAARVLGIMASSELTSSGKLWAVLETTETADYALELTISSIRDVSGGARIATGALAGRSQLEVSFLLRDVRSRRVHAEGAAGHATPLGFAWSDPADTYLAAAMRRTVEELTQKILGAVAKRGGESTPFE